MPENWSVPARRHEAQRWLLDVVDAGDPVLCGGKAAGLAKLARVGFAVPPGICLTTEAYRHWLEHSGLAADLTGATATSAVVDADVRRDLLQKIHFRVQTATIPDALLAALREAIARLTASWDGALAVRSSGAYEDDAEASHAGVHASFVVPGHDPDRVVTAVKACWASLWTEAAWTYRERLGVPHAAAVMAVVIQRFVLADRSGVAFSVDPLTNDRATVVIEAGWGAGAALVSGRMTPDEYRVALAQGVPARAVRRAGRQDQMTVWRDGHEATVAVPDDRRGQPVLGEAQALRLAGLVKAAERALQTPLDIEWVFDGERFGLVQARPITTLARPGEALPEPGTLWTRANLKEVFPDVPSPLALSYLSVALNRMFTAYHAAQGYALPPGAQLVAVFRGRPYLNLTLMQQMAVARGGDPGMMARLFGGMETATPGAAPASAPGTALVERVRLAREMLATFFLTPRRGRRLFRRLRRQDAVLRSVPLDRLGDQALVAHLEGFRATLLHERTVTQLHEVVSAQSRAYMALERLLAAWTSGDAETLVKRLMTGLGTLPNARMTYRLMALGALAASDARARAFFVDELDDAAIRSWRRTLDGTRVGTELERFLKEFGHRGPYESDVMSARFAEDPRPVLRFIQLHVRAGAPEDPARHLARRLLARQVATEEARRALRHGQGRLAFAARWLVFRIVRDALQRLLALRDECRHVTTLLVAHLRRVALEIGRRATRAGLLRDTSDVFLLAWDELPRILVERDRDWRDLALARRRACARNAAVEAPDLLGAEPARRDAGARREASEDELVGFGVSPGVVTRRVKVFRSPADVRELLGEIVVFPTIEPTLTPIFPLVGGLIAEIGGLLSHAAILAREYGLPAVVNVPEATRRLHDGDLVRLDGATGRVRIVERRPAR